MKKKLLVIGLAMIMTFHSVGFQTVTFAADGEVVDKDGPKIRDGNIDLKDTEVIISVNTNEDATLLYFYVDEGAFADKSRYTAFVNGVSRYMYSQTSYLPFAVEENGKWKPSFTTEGEEKQVTDNPSETRPMYSKMLKAGDNMVTVTGLKPRRDGCAWMVAIDKAGNISDNALLVFFQTAKGVPEITTLPEISGVYGNEANTLKVAKEGVAKYQGEEISGSWEVTGAGSELLEIGTTKKYQVTFTPDASYGETYESTTVEVTPIIAKRPLTIKVSDMKKQYGDELPKITFVCSGDMAAGDSKETIADTLMLITEATKDSDVGEYPFTVESNSDKYEVTVSYYVDKDIEVGLKSEGTLHIFKKDVSIEKGTSFKNVQNVQYQATGNYATFPLDVAADSVGAKLKYEVTDAKNSSGQSVDADQILSVAEDGTVTLKGAGSAVIHISVLEAKNYTALDPSQKLDVTVQVEKGDITVAGIKKTYPCNKNTVEKYNIITENTIDEARVGNLKYGNIEVKINGQTADKSAMEKFFEQEPKWVTDPENGKTYLNYQVKQLENMTDDTAEIIMHVEGDNCKINGNDTITLTVGRSEKEETYLPGKSEVKPEAKPGKPEPKSSTKQPTAAKTGDTTNPLGAVAATAGSLIAIGVVITARKKKENKIY